MTLSSRAGTSSVLEFYIGYLRPVFPMENEGEKNHKGGGGGGGECFF